MLWRRDRWETTKDLAKIDEDGYFYHCGRADDVIISAGWTMSAVEIENTMLKHPDVKEAAVIGVPDATRGQVVKAFVVTDRAPSDDFVEELQNFTRERLSQHEFPRIVEFVERAAQDARGQGQPQGPARSRSRRSGRSCQLNSQEKTRQCPRPPTVSQNHRGGSRRSAQADRRQDHRYDGAVELRSHPRRDPPLCPRHRRRQPAVVRSGLCREDQVRHASSRCRASCSPPAASSRAIAAAFPAFTPCGRVRTGPGTSRCCATT